jgi:hypothetical protein
LELWRGVRKKERTPSKRRNRAKSILEKNRFFSSFSFLFGAFGKMKKRGAKERIE